MLLLKAEFMFDFEKLEVYAKAKTFNLQVQQQLQRHRWDLAIKNQLRRAALSIALNIAEGSGRKSKADKRHFFVIARGSVFECVAVMDILQTDGSLEVKDYRLLYSLAEELSKMLFTLVQRLQ